MPRVNPGQQAQAITEVLKQAENNFNQINEEVQRFCQTWEGQLQELAAALQRVEQEGQNYEGEVDQTLKQLEQEVAQSQGLWASLAPGNKLAQKEQVSQKRLALLNTAKKLRQTMQAASQGLSGTLKQFQDQTRKLMKGFTPLKQDFQALAKYLDQLHNGLMVQQSRGEGSMGGQVSQPLAASAMQAMPQQVWGNIPGNMADGSRVSQQQPQGGVLAEMSQELVGNGEARSGQVPILPVSSSPQNQRDKSILLNLQQAMGGLSRAQQLLDNNRVLFQVLQTLDQQLEEIWQLQCKLGRGK